MASQRSQKELPTEASNNDGETNDCACTPTWPCAACYIDGRRARPAITRAPDAGVDL